MKLSKPVLYSSVGRDLTRYEIDATSATLARCESITAPDTIQYVWPHPSGHCLYVTSSHRAPVGGAGTGHHLMAFAVSESGALQSMGDPVPLPERPIHMSVDHRGRFVLVAYSNPSGVTVHRLEDDGRIGKRVEAREKLDVGVYAHQVMAMPGDQSVILVARGHNASAGSAEVPGALKVMRFDDGVLSNRQDVAPNGGFGFGPRHLDFHPNKTWIYVSLERQNALQMFSIEAGDRISEQARFSCDYLADTSHVWPRQLGGTVHVHPNGRFAYVANRADFTEEHEGRQVLAGGENSLVVFRLDQATGEPHLIQRITPGTMHVRTFAIDPSGTLLFAAGILPLWVRSAGAVGGVERIPAAISVFRIADDGTLSFARKYEVEAGPAPQWWMGIPFTG
jgi:hypothetical protein